MATLPSAKNTIEDYEQRKALLQKKLLREIQTLRDSATSTEAKVNIGLKKNTSNLFRNASKSKSLMDVRDFNHVLYIDPKLAIAEIEGMTSYEEIVKETLKMGFLPCVVPELKSITIGGALAGIGIESSSFRYGLVHESIIEYELLLGDGRIVTCSATNEHRALFFAFPNTYATLGYALKVKIKLIPAKPYLKLTHVKFDNAKMYFQYIQALCLKNRKHSVNQKENRTKSEKYLPSADYIDGVIFHEKEMFVTLAEFVDKAPFTSNYQYMNIYYRSIQKKSYDYLTTKDYIWRWDTDWFWCSKHFFMQSFIPRLLFGKWLLKSTVYWKIRDFFNKHSFANKLVEKFYGKTETIIQDVDIPIEKSEEFLKFFLAKIGIKPIWICPIQPYQIENEYTFYKMQADTLYINFGFWDMRPSKNPIGYYNRLIEQNVSELGGNKSLYSSVYYTFDEFWQIYDKPYYMHLKTLYDPNKQLQDLYYKTTYKNISI